ncbi:hypothetical protein GVN24_11475 [Rhizobium sp. CRIBSB]|nr:hypothetical protein [Rhizobium sp. CRIBSB]
MPRPKIGDVIEIKTSCGLFYAQFAHKHPRYGALLRVFGNSYALRPFGFDDVVKSDPAFMCFFPLGAAVNRGIVPIVGHVVLPPEACPFPVFRSGVVDPSTGKVAVWWLWDGEKEWRVEELTAEQRKFSLRGIWNDTLLIERLETGWRPENDPS